MIFIISSNPIRNDCHFQGFWSEISAPEGMPFEVLFENSKSQKRAGVILKLTSPHYNYVLYLSLPLLKSQSIVLKFLYIVNYSASDSWFLF